MKPHEAINNTLQHDDRRNVQIMYKLPIPLVVRQGCLRSVYLTFQDQTVTEAHSSVTCNALQGIKLRTRVTFFEDQHAATQHKVGT